MDRGKIRLRVHTRSGSHSDRPSNAFSISLHICALLLLLPPNHSLLRQGLLSRCLSFPFHLTPRVGNENRPRLRSHLLGFKLDKSHIHYSFHVGDILRRSLYARSSPTINIIKSPCLPFNPLNPRASHSEMIENIR
ncbi:hypothetical protein ARMGADRAFT_731791 [Armillaria gallica]|uniref:Uncharacterized protein n=1 Tax=Armillaria gallica TaxID=47427 RepID=A0A2H3CHI4_ARMGA|nr:hypothetical protein ARMGADRAFT_731791 [Armillaria gallica]